MLENHICPHIVTNTMLLKLLDDISFKTIDLLFPPEPEFLGLHRTAIRVVHKTALDGLSFYLLIPLRGDPKDTFDVLGIDSLQYPIPHTDAFMLHYISKHYLVISEPRTHYFLMDDFNVCRKYDNLLICPPMGPVSNRNTDFCELALFLGKQSVSNCVKHKLLRSFHLFLSNICKDGFIQLVNIKPYPSHCLSPSQHGNMDFS